MRVRALTQDVIALLDASGLPWELRSGKRHWKLIVAGRFITIVPHGSNGDARMGHSVQNSKAIIRRALRKLGKQ